MEEVSTEMLVFDNWRVVLEDVLYQTLVLET